MTDTDDARAALQRLTGEWKFTASVGGQILGAGWTTFALSDSGAFLVQAADDDDSGEGSAEWRANSPMPIEAVIGFDDTTGQMTMLYADARGVRRIYQMSVGEREWRMWRNAPGFNQRFVGRFGDEGRSIVGRWEQSADGSAWETDFEMAYTRLDGR